MRFYLSITFLVLSSLSILWAEPPKDTTDQEESDGCISNQEDFNQALRDGNEEITLSKDIYYDKKAPPPINLTEDLKPKRGKITIGIKKTEQKEKGKKGEEKKIPPQLVVGNQTGMGRGFYVGGGHVTFDGITFANFHALGRDGESGKTPTAGKGAAGGALFVDSDATVTLINPSFHNCSAFGGSGGGLMKKRAKKDKNNQFSIDQERHPIFDRPSLKELDGQDQGTDTPPLFGGKKGEKGSGGGGAGLGGAIYLAPKATLNVQGKAEFSNNWAHGGSGGTSDKGTFALNGAGLGNDIFMCKESTLNFNLTCPLTLRYPIAGDFTNPEGSDKLGGIFKRGKGRLELNGANTFTGMLKVSEGELSINGSVKSSVVVEKEGFLTGSFTAEKQGNNLESGTITNAAVLKPGGDGKGTIYLEGPFYKQTYYGELIVDITPDGDLERRTIVLTDGEAQLNGTLHLILERGNYIKGREFHIIDGNPNRSKFSKILLNGHNQDNVQIEIKYNSVKIKILNDWIFQDHGISQGNSQKVADALLNALNTPASSGFVPVIESLGLLTDQDLNDTLHDFSPAIFGTLEWINLRNNSLLTRLIANHQFELWCSPRALRGCAITGCDSNPWYDPCCRTSFWINPFGSLQATKKKIEGLPRYSANVVGGLVGIDHYLGCNFFVGAAFLYAHTHLHWQSSRGDGNINSYTGALYASWQGSCFSIDTSALGGRSRHKLKRILKVGNSTLRARSDPSGHFFTGHLGLQFYWDSNCWTFEPYALADYHYFDRGGFKENGGGALDLDLSSKSQELIRGEAGLKVCYGVDCGDYCYSPYIALSWVGDFPLEESVQKGKFRGQNTPLYTKSYDSSSQLVSPQVGFKWTHCNGFSLGVGYKGFFSSDTVINEMEGRLEKVF